MGLLYLYVLLFTIFSVNKNELITCSSSGTPPLCVLRPCCTDMLRVFETQIQQPHRFMDIEMWNAVRSENTWRFVYDISEVAI